MSLSNQGRGSSETKMNQKAQTSPQMGAGVKLTEIQNFF
jgi:hypothetical protein